MYKLQLIAAEIIAMARVNRAIPKFSKRKSKIEAVSSIKIQWVKKIHFATRSSVL
jgi:transposase